MGELAEGRDSIDLADRLNKLVAVMHGPLSTEGIIPALLSRSDAPLSAL